MQWYYRVTSVDADDVIAIATVLADFISTSEAKYEDLSRQAKVASGHRIEEIAMKVPGLAEYTFGLLQEADAVLRYLNLQTERVLGKARRQYTEHYQRALSDRTAEKYAESDQSVIDYKLLCLEVGLLSSKFAGLSKNLEYLHFQIGNITKLRCAGIEDATL